MKTASGVMKDMWLESSAPLKSLYFKQRRDLIKLCKANSIYSEDNNVFITA